MTTPGDIGIKPVAWTFQLYQYGVWVDRVTLSTMAEDEDVRNVAPLYSDPDVRAALAAKDAKLDEQEEELQAFRGKFDKMLGMAMQGLRDKVAAKDAEITRLTNNRDMFKGQVDRQAKALEKLRIEIAATYRTALKEHSNGNG